jgi:transcriptional regulator with XRE-family HTH domain
MQLSSTHRNGVLSGHALRNANLRRRSLDRAKSAPPLAGTIVRIRADTLGMTRMEFARQSGINRGTLRDLELGIHTPTRRILQRFVKFCEGHAVSDNVLEELRRLYAGMGDTLEQLISRLELKAGSPRELARRVGISPATLWEYRRGNFPLPLSLLRQLCEAVVEDSELAERLWYQEERRRLLARGYPEALAEFWVLSHRKGYTEKQLLALGLASATARRLRYLELPPWDDVAKVARKLCRGDREVQALQKLWSRDARAQQEHLETSAFGNRLKQLRKQKGVSRRELADLFGIGGKKPARIIKHIEEDGFYSAQAYPAGLVAVMTPDPKAQARLLELWRQRRSQFHRRRRPEIRIELRLVRELYGFSIADMEPVLGYSRIEYQRIERGVIALQDSARARILQAIERTGRVRVEALLRHRSECEAERFAWRAPQTLTALVILLARREGGLIPLMRFLRRAGLKGLWTGRLRAIAHGAEIPPWRVLEQIGQACDVPDLSQARLDWVERYRTMMGKECSSPLGVELRLLIAEVATTLRAFSPRLGFNYSVLVRDLQRIDRDQPVRWFHVERILKAAGLRGDEDRWREIHALWYTAVDRNRKPTPWANGKRLLNGSVNGH